MKLPIRQPIKRSIKQSIIAGGSVSLLEFAGSTSVSIPEFKLTGANGEFSNKVIFAPLSMGVEVDLYSPSGRLYKNSSDQFAYSYTDTTATLRTVTLTALTVLVDQEYSPTVELDGTGVSLSAGGFTAKQLFAIDPSAMSVTRIGSNAGATANTLHGREWDIAPTDDSGIQGGDYLEGNEVDLYGQVGPITLPGDFDISFDWVVSERVGSASDRVGLFDDGSALNRLLISGTYFDTSFVVIDGEFHNFNNASKPQALGQHTKVMLRRSGSTVSLSFDGGDEDTITSSSPFAISRLLQAVGEFSGSIVSNFRVTNENGDTYEYLTKNSVIDNGDGTAVAVNTGNTGAAFNGVIQNFTPSNLKSIPNNSRLYRGTDGEGTTFKDSKNPSGTTDGLIEGPANWVPK